MAHIEHVALWVDDLALVTGFYVRHFGALAGPVYENPAKGFRSRFLTLAAGARIEVMTTTSHAPLRAAAGAHRMGLAHLALALGSERAVDELTAELARAGVPVLDGPRRTGDGYYESVVLDPEGNRIEITA
jgi:lactoylglutathione lyase